MNAFDNDLKHVRQELRRTKGTNERTVEAIKVHKAISASLDRFLESISIQDLIDSYADDGDMTLLMAEGLEREAARLRQKAK